MEYSYLRIQHARRHRIGDAQEVDGIHEGKGSDVRIHSKDEPKGNKRVVRG